LSTILSQIDVLNQQLKTQDADVQLIKNQLAELQTQYQGIFKQLEELQKLSQILAEIEKMKIQITQLDTRYNTILTGLAQNKQQLDALKTQITSVQTQLAENLTKIAQFTSQLGDQGVVIGNILKQIDLLKANNAELIKLMESLLIGKSPVPTNGLVAWYPFNGNANDESGNGNNGIVQGPVLTTNRGGINNTAYLFDGVNDYINISPSLSEINSLSQFTISTWINKDGTSVGTLFGHWIDNSQPISPIGITQTINSQNKFGISMVGGKTTISNSVIESNKWQNITLVYNGTSAAGSRLKLYINGAFMENLLDTNFPTASGSIANRTYIGATPGLNPGPIYQFFKGKIDDLAIWNRALSADEISKIFSGQGF
jgi:hypothetical protein